MKRLIYGIIFLLLSITIFLYITPMICNDLNIEYRIFLLISFLIFFIYGLILIISSWYYKRRNKKGCTSINKNGPVTHVKNEDIIEEVLKKIAEILDCTECTVSDHTATHLLDITTYINKHYDNSQN